jgi:hypothetical protein
LQRSSAHTLSWSHYDVLDLFLGCP